MLGEELEDLSLVFAQSYVFHPAKVSSPELKSKLSIPHGSAVLMNMEEAAPVNGAASKKT